MSVEQKLLMSPTFERLFHLSQGLLINVHNKIELKEAFSTCGIELMIALDNGRIHFNTTEDKAMLHALLAVAIDVSMNGNLKNAFTKVTIN